jgi:hypothetical protein
MLASTDFWRNPVTTTVIAAIIGSAGAVAGNWIQSRSNDKALNQLRGQKELDKISLQLSEFYSPFFMLRTQSLALWRQLADPGATPGSGQWSLIDHIEEIRAEVSEDRRLIVNNIIGINSSLVDLLEKKGGLLDQFPPPEPLLIFLSHAAALKRYWELGTNIDPGKSAYVKFPKGVDESISDSIVKLRDQLGIISSTA